MSRLPTRLMCVVAIAAAVSGCAWRLTAPQDRGWTAFHECQPDSRSAAMEDLLVGGRVHYWTQEGVDFSTMKACMEARGYSCDLGLTIGTRPHTYCYPKAS